MASASLHFQSVDEDDVDKVLNRPSGRFKFLAHNILLHVKGIIND